MCTYVRIFVHFKYAHTLNLQCDVRYHAVLKVTIGQIAASRQTRQSHLGVYWLLEAGLK